MANDITINTSNSPYMIPGPTATFGTVTVAQGGFMYLEQPTTLTITKLTRPQASTVQSKQK